MSECKCSMRVKIVGDGCQVCNPSMHIEMLEEDNRSEERRVGKEGRSRWSP